jgi:hypothetical protein
VDSGAMIARVAVELLDRTVGIEQEDRNASSIVRFAMRSWRRSGA